MSEASGTTINKPQRARLRRVARPWRLAFILYAIALTTGTHWPRLTLGPEIPATDKLIHMLAFAGLTILLWRTKWFSRRWIVGIIALAWAVLDEVSQGIPILNRTATWHDVLANGLGVFTAIVWMWALMPIGFAEGANQARLRLHAYVFDEMFARWSPWLAVAGGLMAGGAPLWMVWSAMPVEMIRMAIVIAIAVAVVVTLLIWMRLWQRRWEEAHAVIPCLECGTRISTLDHRHIGSGQCDRCGAAVNATQWVGRSASSRSNRLALGTSMGLMVKPALLGFGALVIGFAAIFALPVVYEMVLTQGSTGAGGSARWAPRLAHLIGSLPPELTATIDLSAYLVLFAVVVRVYRTGLARYHDRAVSCRRCGHDLRGTPTIEGSGGQGRCGECGAPFVRSA